MEADHAGLGALIRRRREAKGLTMEALAREAGVGRTTLHRLENGVHGRPVPSKVARVLRVLDIGVGEVDGLVPDREFVAELSVWLDRDRHVETVIDYLAHAKAKVAEPTDDAVLFLFAPGDGTALSVTVVASGDRCESVVEELAKAAARMGLQVSVPA